MVILMEVHFTTLARKMSVESRCTDGNCSHCTAEVVAQGVCLCCIKSAKAPCHEQQRGRPFDHFIRANEVCLTICSSPSAFRGSRPLEKLL